MRALLITIALLSFPAVAQSVRTAGGLSRGAADSLYYPLTGGALSGGVELFATQTACNAALALSWDGDENMGLQRAAADTLLLCLAATEVLRVTGSLFTITGVRTFSTGDALVLGDTNVVTYAGAAGTATCGSGHRCVVVTGSGSRQATVMIQAGAAVSEGPSLVLNWADATNDREVWKIQQSATFVDVVNTDEDNDVDNFVSTRFYDTGGMRLFRVIGASPAEPVACADATVSAALDTRGTIVYVDDTDDTADARVCVCATDNDDATEDWRLLSDEATACPFF